MSLNDFYKDISEVKHLISKISFAFFLISGLSPLVNGQDLHLKGFFDFDASYKNERGSFSLGEEDLFITSELNDRISFLGETVFKFASESSTNFTLGLERAVIKYNFSGNHNLLVGKHHTPVNYWNDTYHHGRVFFPTIFRPAMFNAGIVPLHTVGIGLQGHDLGKIKFGYDLMAGNGIGSSEVLDNDKSKSITAAVHIKPVEKMRIGGSVYYDIISAGSHIHTGVVSKQQVDEVLSTLSLGYFGKKAELLAEGTYGINRTDSLGSAPSKAYYIYGGYRIMNKLVLYGRFDQLIFDEKEMYFTKNDLKSIVGGIRYEINFITVVKLEFQNDNSKQGGNLNSVNAQFAIGF